MKPTYYCVICRTPVLSSRYYLCSHCYREFSYQEPWVDFLIHQEHAEREHDRRLSKAGIGIVPLSAITDEEISSGVKLA